MAFKATYDNVVVKVINEEEVSSSGLVIAGNSDKTFNKAEVKFVGEGRRNKVGNIVPVAVNVGDTVYFFIGVGTKIKVNDETLILLKEDDIFATEN